jgi:hypothetical protein
VEPTKWYLDTERWPGPDRVRWKIDRDVVEPSPDGRLACVLYSCCEIRLGCEVDLLTLLSGPPESPTVLLQPPGFTCLDFSPRPSAQWLGGSRFVVVTAYLYRPVTNKIDLLALTFLDTAESAFAHHEIPLNMASRRLVESGDEWAMSQGPDGPPEVRLSASSLAWQPWSRLQVAA